MNSRIAKKIMLHTLERNYSLAQHLEAERVFRVRSNRQRNKITRARRLCGCERCKTTLLAYREGQSLSDVKFAYIVAGFHADCPSNAS